MNWNLWDNSNLTQKDSILQTSHALQAIPLKTLTANASVLCINPQGKSKVTAEEEVVAFSF